MTHWAACNGSHTTNQSALVPVTGGVSRCFWKQFWNEMRRLHRGTRLILGFKLWISLAVPGYVVGEDFFACFLFFFYSRFARDTRWTRWVSVVAAAKTLCLEVLTHVCFSILGHGVYWVLVVCMCVWTPEVFIMEACVSCSDQARWSVGLFQPRVT